MPLPLLFSVWLLLLIDFSFFSDLNSQEAVAQAFLIDLKRMDDPDCYFYSLPRGLEEKRNRMAQMLLGAGLKPVVPEGGYFMIVDVSALS